jgi:hypothetical protein
MRRLVAGAVGLALCLAVVGCGSSPGLTKANFDRIKTDGSMSKEDVDKLMGSQGTELTGELAKQFAGMVGQAGKGAGELFGKMPDGGKVGEDMGKMLGEAGKMFGKMGDMLGAAMPKALRWGDDNKYVVCMIMNGKIVSKAEKGL